MSLAHSEGEFQLRIQPDAVIIPFRRRETVVRPSMHEARRFGQLASWVFAYVDYIYENGDHKGRPMPKSAGPIVWESSRGLRAEAKGLVGFKNSEIRGTSFIISRSFEEYDEVLSLESDGYKLVNGSYNWNGNELQRPAPDADFRGVMTANEAGITPQGSELLEGFKDGVSNIGKGMRMSGVWNTSLSVVPPSTIVGRYVTPD